MNEDFGVGRRRRVTDFDFTPREPRINPDKYRPSSYRPNDEQDAIAIAADDPAWNAISLDDDPFQDTSGNDYSDNSSDDDPSDGPEGKQPGDPEDPEPKKPWYKRFFAVFGRLSRKQWLIIGGVLLILIAGATSYILTRPADVKQETVTKSKPKPPAPEPPKSPLTGLDVSEEDAKRPVIGVMIENSPDARPQSGLHKAGVVYEAIAEYGITRFLALYQEANPDNLGPVRSARPYYVDWAKSFNASYAHVGGSPTALEKIRGESVRDLDQFANSGAYRRIDSRYAPHNVYTTMNQLRELTAAKGWTGSEFTSFPRKKEAKAEQVTAQAIDFDISGPTYNVHYDYDPATNSYLRTMGGEAHNDADSGDRIAPKVVIALATQFGTMADGYHSNYLTTGNGTVKIFQDGTVTEGTWTRDADGQYKFLDADSKPIALNPGQTWITVLGDPAAATYTAPPAPAPTPAPAP